MKQIGILISIFVLAVFLFACHSDKGNSGKAGSEIGQTAVSDNSQAGQDYSSGNANNITDVGEAAFDEAWANDSSVVSSKTAGNVSGGLNSNSVSSSNASEGSSNASSVSSSASSGSTSSSDNDGFMTQYGWR